MLITNAIFTSGWKPKNHPFHLHPDFWKWRSKNLGLEKLRFISNHKKFWGSPKLIFFRFGTSFFFSVETWKKRFKYRTWIFFRVWNRPWFSETGCRLKVLDIWYQHFSFKMDQALLPVKFVYILGNVKPTPKNLLIFYSSA